MSLRKLEYFDPSDYRSLLSRKVLDTNSDLVKAVWNEGFISDKQYGISVIYLEILNNIQRIACNIIDPYLAL